MNSVDTALGWCMDGRTAHSFSAFTSMMVEAGSGAMAVAQAFAADGTLEQSFTKCPVFPQKRQRLLSMWHCHSTRVSLPSLPSFPVRLGPGFEVSVGFPWALGWGSVVFLAHWSVFGSIRESCLPI